MAVKVEIDGGIDYRGQVCRSAKYQVTGYCHFLPVEETLERILPILKEIGVSRIGNITGLDRIGIPVVNAIRPNLDGYAVQHGKGLTIKGAKVSAGMEAIERYYGSHVTLTAWREIYRRLREKHHVIPLERLLLSRYSLFHVDLPEWWVPGWDIMNRQEVAVPYNLVNLIRKNGAAEPDNFQSTSNGLAAGTDFLEAVAQALLEVIERDAVTCHDLAARYAGAEFPVKRVEKEMIPFPGVREVLERIEAADVMPLLFDCETDTGVPVFNCFLIDSLYPHAILCHGMGASLNSATAMTRAITEAAQARAVYRGGARDIYFQDQFFIHKMYRKEEIVSKIEKIVPNVSMVHFRNEETATFEGDIRRCLEKLKNVGIEQVIVLDISPPQGDVFVVRVIVPGLEGYVLPNFSPGQRAKEYSEGKEI